MAKEAESIAVYEYYGSQVSGDIDFPAFTQSLREGVNLILTSTEMSDDDKLEALDDQVDTANNFLGLHGVLCANALIKEGAFVRDDPENPILIRGTVYGEYEGIEPPTENLLDQGLPSEPLHKIHVIGIDGDPDSEQYTYKSAYLPISSGDIQLLTPSLSQPANKGWLKKICKTLFENFEETNPQDMHAMYEQIARSRHSRYPRQQNIDWLLEHLEYFAGLSGGFVKIRAQEVFHVRNGSIKPITRRYRSLRLRGEVLGYCEIDDYEVIRDASRAPIIKTIPGQKILAVLLQTDANQQLVQVPLRACILLEHEEE